MGAESLNLEAAATVIKLDFPWEAIDVIQAENRVDRISQEKDTVEFIDIIAQGTIDDDVLEILERKKLLASITVDGQIGEVDNTKYQEYVRRRLAEKAFNAFPGDYDRMRRGDIRRRDRQWFAEAYADKYGTLGEAERFRAGFRELLRYLGNDDAYVKKNGTHVVGNFFAGPGKMADALGAVGGDTACSGIISKRQWKVVEAEPSAALLDIVKKKKFPAVFGDIRRAFSSFPVGATPEGAEPAPWKAERYDTIIADEDSLRCLPRGNIPGTSCVTYKIWALKEMLERLQEGGLFLYMSQGSLSPYEREMLEQVFCMQIVAEPSTGVIICRKTAVFAYAAISALDAALLPLAEKRGEEIRLSQVMALQRGGEKTLDQLMGWDKPQWVEKIKEIQVMRERYEKEFGEPPDPLKLASAVSLSLPALGYALSLEKYPDGIPFNTDPDGNVIVKTADASRQASGKTKTAGRKDSDAVRLPPEQWVEHITAETVKQAYDFYMHKEGRLPTFGDLMLFFPTPPNQETRIVCVNTIAQCLRKLGDAVKLRTTVRLKSPEVKAADANNAKVTFPDYNAKFKENQTGRKEDRYKNVVRFYEKIKNDKPSPGTFGEFLQLMADKRPRVIFQIGQSHEAPINDPEQLQSIIDAFKDSLFTNPKVLESLSGMLAMEAEKVSAKLKEHIWNKWLGGGILTPYEMRGIGVTAEQTDGYLVALASFEEHAGSEYVDNLKQYIMRNYPYEQKHPATPDNIIQFVEQVVQSFIERPEDIQLMLIAKAGEDEDFLRYIPAGKYGVLLEIARMHRDEFHSMKDAVEYIWSLRSEKDRDDGKTLTARVRLSKLYASFGIHDAGLITRLSNEEISVTSEVLSYFARNGMLTSQIVKAIAESDIGKYRTNPQMFITKIRFQTAPSLRSEEIADRTDRMLLEAAELEKSMYESTKDDALVKDVLKVIQEDLARGDHERAAFDIEAVRQSLEHKYDLKMAHYMLTHRSELGQYAKEKTLRSFMIYLEIYSKLCKSGFKIPRYQDVIAGLDGTIFDLEQYSKCLDKLVSSPNMHGREFLKDPTDIRSALGYMWWYVMTENNLATKDIIQRGHPLYEKCVALLKEARLEDVDALIRDGKFKMVFAIHSARRYNNEQCWQKTLKLLEHDEVMIALQPLVWVSLMQNMVKKEMRVSWKRFSEMFLRKKILNDSLDMRLGVNDVLYAYQLDLYCSMFRQRDDIAKLLGEMSTHEWDADLKRISDTLKAEHNALMKSVGINKDAFMKVQQNYCPATRLIAEFFCEAVAHKDDNYEIANVFNAQVKSLIEVKARHDEVILPMNEKKDVVDAVRHVMEIVHEKDKNLRLRMIADMRNSQVKLLAYCMMTLADAGCPLDDINVGLLLEMYYVKGEFPVLGSTGIFGETVVRCISESLLDAFSGDPVNNKVATMIFLFLMHDGSKYHKAVAEYMSRLTEQDLQEMLARYDDVIQGMYRKNNRLLPWQPEAIKSYLQLYVKQRKVQKGFDDIRYFPYRKYAVLEMKWADAVGWERYQMLVPVEDENKEEYFHFRRMMGMIDKHISAAERNLERSSADVSAQNVKEGVKTKVDEIMKVMGITARVVLSADFGMPAVYDVLNDIVYIDMEYLKYFKDNGKEDAFYYAVAYVLIRQLGLKTLSALRAVNDIDGRLHHQVGMKKDVIKLLYKKLLDDGGGEIDPLMSVFFNLLFDGFPVNSNYEVIEDEVKREIREMSEKIKTGDDPLRIWYNKQRTPPTKNPSEDQNQNESVLNPVQRAA